MSTSSDCCWRQEQGVCVFDYPAIIADAEDSADDDHGSGPEREHQAKTEGIREGEERVRRDFEQALARERQAITEALKDFVTCKNRYFQQVEAEVVHLALAIARKVLQREAQVDPLVLAGIVRVALGQIDNGTDVTLTVNAADASSWRHLLENQSGSEVTVEIQEDTSVPVGCCRLRTKLGVAELGIEPQLKEIENGLHELMAKRPMRNE